MTRRYHVDSLPADGGPVELSADEASHAFRVMRRRPGDRIELFDGRGHCAEAEILTLDRRGGTCLAGPAVRQVIDSKVALHVATALPSGDRAREMIERLTELNVARMTPLRFERTQRPIQPAAMKKLHRVMLEACKQCGRNQLPRLDDEISYPDFLAQHRPVVGQGRWVMTPGGVPAGAAAASQLVLIGPEGGLTRQEQELAGANGFLKISLGPLILRVETAAASVAALVNCR